MTTTWTPLPKGTTASWTNIPKAVGTTSVISLQYGGGDPIGLLLAFTYSSVIGASSIVTSKWTSLPKGTTVSWTNVPKAT